MIELLSPAGDREKLEYALAYGADAVYAGLKEFSLRAQAGNFSKDEMEDAVKYAHSLNKKVFVTINIIARNRDLEKIADISEFLGKINADGIIVADPGLIGLIKKKAPKLDIHISTQANTLNSQTANLYACLGAKRIILARELSLSEIREIRDSLPKEVELEAFVHGAMCVSYSGRCLISNYLAGRDSNRGECAQPCRWNYALVEEKRPGEYFPVIEDERGTFFFNSKDLCMIEHIPKLIEAGISSLKIEGRMKSLFYAASVTIGYRKAIDEYYKDPQNYKFKREWLEEVSKASHRDFTTAFYFDEKPNAQVYTTNSYIRTHAFTGVVLEYDDNTKMAKILQKNPLFKDDTIEVMNPDGRVFIQKASHMTDEEGKDIDSTPHPHMIYFLKMNEKVGKFSFLIKGEGEKK